MHVYSAIIDLFDFVNIFIFLHAGDKVILVPSTE
jgi:hypothetical protein